MTVPPGQPMRRQSEQGPGQALGAAASPADEEKAPETGPIIGRLPGPGPGPGPVRASASAPVSAAPVQREERRPRADRPSDAVGTGDTMMVEQTSGAERTSRLSSSAVSAQAAAAVAERVRETTAAAQPALAEPTGGTVYGANRLSGTAEPDRLGRPLDAVRLEPHRAPVTALKHLSVPRMASGVLLGNDSDKASVVLRLFRPEVTRIAMVGGLWPARLLIFRALALGARVVVFTHRPEAWNGFGRVATGRDDRVAVLPVERPVVVAASPASPALHVYDLGQTGPQAPPALGPWNAQLTVLPTLTAFGFDAMQAAHVTVLRRLTVQESSAAVPILGLTGQAPRLVQQVRNDMVSVVGGGRVRYTYLQPTQVEARLFGSAGSEAVAISSAR